MLFITQPRVGHSYNEILALQMTARQMDWEVIPAHYGWRLTEELIATKERGVPYGSQLFCETICQQMNWKLKLNTFDWLARLPYKYRQRHVEFMNLERARKITETKFIKPADDKCFDAKVYEGGTFNPKEFVVNETPVLVSEVVEFVSECRCFVKNQTCLTSCCYLHNGDINLSENYYVVDPLPFINDLLNNFQTEDAVIDVGLIKDKGWAVIETNPTWASGIYGCDPYQVLLAMENTCEAL